MGVHPACGMEHLPFRQHSGGAQFRKGLLRRKVPGPPANLGAPGKIRGQRGGAGQEGEHIHIPVAAAVLPVHQSRLGGRRHLVQQRLAGQTGHRLAAVLFQRRVNQSGGFFLKLGDRVGAASGAGLGRAAADQAAPAWLPKLLTVHLAAVRAQHVHIEQPPHGGLILQQDCHSFRRLRGALHYEKSLISRFFADFLKIQHLYSGGAQLPAQESAAQFITPADLGTVFHRPRNIHGIADHRRAEPVQQRPLPLGTALPGAEHLHQRYFHSHPPERILPSIIRGKPHPCNPFFKKRP